MLCWVSSMCCFSGKVESVANTRIFAREVESGVQGLVYQMALNTSQEVAMILPIPIRNPAWEKAVKFINLEEYDDFFERLDSLYPVPRAQGPAPEYTLGTDSVIEVIKVGSYEASFVPTMDDFKRLDARFRIAPEAWAKLPQYQDFSFAVFKLKAGEQKVHPMAFIFESRLPGQLFFPTVHIHDGEVHAKEHFDHTLYAQGWLNGDFKEKGWMVSPEKAETKVDEKKAKGLVWGGGKVYRKNLQGMLENKDQVLFGKS